MSLRCDPDPQDGTSAPLIPCPCCGGTLTETMLRDLLERARALEAAPRQPSRGPLGHDLLIDPHAHMISRTTDDYEAMARAGVVAVIEPAFWLGQPRTSVGTFIDYFSTIIGFEQIGRASCRERV